MPNKRISLKSSEAYEQVQDLHERKSVTDSVNLLTLRKEFNVSDDLSFTLTWALQKSFLSASVTEQRVKNS